EGHHFLRHWPSGVVDNGYSTGWKLVAQNISDMNAMGAITSAINISLAMPKNTPAHCVWHFGRGIANACYWLGAPQLVISGGNQLPNTGRVRAPWGPSPRRLIFRLRCQTIPRLTGYGILVVA